MPSFDEMLKNMPLHYAFYLRGVMNSVLPDFMNPVDREITEKNISGEALELFRGMAQYMAPDLKDGEIFQATGYSAPVTDFLGTGSATPETMSLNNQIRNALGNFGLTKVNGEYVIFDTYDFDPNFSDGISASSMLGSLSKGDPQPIAQRLGEILMPDTNDDNMKIRIRIPNEPSVIDVDYDDPIPDGAEDFVFRGPMTNKRKSMFDAFTSTLAQGVSQLNPISTAQASDDTINEFERDFDNAQDSVILDLFSLEEQKPILKLMEASGIDAQSAAYDLGLIR